MRIFFLLGMLILPAMLPAQPPGVGGPQGERRGGGGRPQQPGMFAWWDSPIAGDLNLSDQQQQQIRTHTREFRNRLFDASNAIKKAEADLEDIMNEESVDQRRANDAIERVAGARAEMTRSVLQLSLRLRGVLTYPQWQELQKRVPRGGGGPPMGGPDGMGPGGREGKKRDKRADGPPGRPE